jgi:fimbrial isopeptide formation D2 family protein/LPXTG-motif cell wall-anchored protein
VSADWTPGSNTFGMIEDSTYSNKSAAKKSTLDLTKTSESPSDYSGDDGETVAVGDILDFTVTTTIPGYGDTFDHPMFKLVDVMEDLELQTDTVAVTAAGATASSYTIDPKTTAGYTVTFKEDYLKTLKVPTAVTITYKAKVLASATVANVNKEQNTVTLEYSHNPATESDQKPGGDKEYKKEKTTHYTFSIDADNLMRGSNVVGESGSEIIKISVDRNGNPIYSETKTWSNVTREEYEASPLANCEFALYKVASVEGNTWTKASDVYKTATSDVNGRIKFEGLDEGKYILIETKAPDGFVRDTSEHKIEIIADTETKSITEYYDQDGNWYTQTGTGLKPFTYEYTELNSYQITFDGSTVASHTFDHESNNTEIKWSNKGSIEAPSSIHNTKGVELPSTGGIGTTIFYVGGGLLVLAAVILLVTKRRMSGND